MLVCSFRYPACNAHAPYCHLWPAPLCHISPHYPINVTIFEKKSLNTKCVFRFSLQLFCETLLIISSIERDLIKSVYKVFIVKSPLFLPDINANWNFMTYVNIIKYKFFENLSIWDRVVPCEQTAVTYYSTYYAYCTLVFFVWSTKVRPTSLHTHTHTHTHTIANVCYMHWVPNTWKISNYWCILTAQQLVQDTILASECGTHRRIM